MNRRTPLYEIHVAAGARMVEFAGWEMPLHYGSQLQEHHAVRGHAGLFDVSHMTILDVTGSHAERWLRELLANDVARLPTAGTAHYGAMLNERGGVIDDLITYRLEDRYRLVCNAATRSRVLEWIERQSRNRTVTVVERTGTAMIAVQGPQAAATLAGVLRQYAGRLDALEPFHATWFGDWLVARTGYTGENGFEIMLPGDAAQACWKALAATGARPAGLGARDTLRLEAGLNLHGHEMDEDVSPLEANMGWTVAREPYDRNFMGRAALEALRDSGDHQILTGLVMTQPGVLRAGQLVHLPGTDEPGVITSGTYSPTLGHAIALARVPHIEAHQALVDIRGRRAPVRIVRPPFVRHGKKVYN